MVFICGCSSQKPISGNYTQKTECIGVALDGSQTLNVGGVGQNKADAIEQAKKNGVRDVLFNGRIDGKSKCNQVPVVLEVNAQLKYENYFNNFFAVNGKYRDFISYKKEPGTKMIVIQTRGESGSLVSCRIIIRVLRAELKQQMMTDGIVK